jgi:putative MATE family efflux protein
MAPPASPPKSGGARTRLLLEGPIASTLLRLGAPNVVVNVVLIAVTTTVDAYFVGRLGASALAGLALVFPLIMLMQQVANSSMGAATASAIARALGAGRRDDAASLVVHGLVIGAGMAAAFTTAVLLGGPSFFRLMGGSGATLDAAVEYATVIFGGALVYWVLGTLTSAVRGAGQAAVLAAVYVVAELLHVILVPALVFGVGPIPPLGITGAAVATVTSFALSTLTLAWYLASGRTVIALSLRSVRLRRALFAEILRVGAPSALTPLLNNCALAVLTAFVCTLGATALAGFGAAVRLEYVLVPLTFGVGAGVLAMVGTSIGAGQMARAARVAWTAAGLTVSATGAIGIVALAWPSLWIGLFSTNPDVHAMGAHYLRVMSLTYPFLGLGLTLAYAFQAAGRPLWPLVAIVSRVALVTAGGWAVVHFAESSVGVLALVAACALVAYGSILALAFRAGAWRSAASTLGGRR